MNALNLDFGLLNLERIVIVPNFLDAYNRGYGPKIEKTAFVIYGPLIDESFRLIRHEFLHSIVKPLVLKKRNFPKKIKKFSKYNQPQIKLKK
jgi:hypothetical protein